MTKELSTPSANLQATLALARELQIWKARGKCSKCEGNGYTAEHDQHNPETGECMNCPVQVQCNDCYATGYAVIEHFPKIVTTLEALAEENARLKEQNKGLREEIAYVKHIYANPYEYL